MFFGPLFFFETKKYFITTARSGCHLISVGRVPFLVFHSPNRTVIYSKFDGGNEYTADRMREAEFNREKTSEFVHVCPTLNLEH